MKMTTLHPFTALRAIRDLFADPNDTKYVFEIIEALQGPALIRMRKRLCRSEQGRRLLSEQPDLLPLLNDRESLRALPDGSLGRAYLAFVEGEGISADGLVGASKLTRRGDEAAELRWIRDWLRDTHDLWHAVLGYEGDLVGEAALLAFSHHETRNMGVGMIASVAWFKLGRIPEAGVGARRAIVDGRRRARRASWFVEVPWHQWLARPVSDVRRELGVEGPAQYRPVRSHEVDVSLAA